MPLLVVLGQPLVTLWHEMVQDKSYGIAATSPV